MNGSGVEHRAAAVSLVNGLTALLSIVFQLVSVPVCLHFWGRERYGAWLAVFAAATMFRMVDGGFIDYVGNRLNLLYHTDRDEMRRVLASSALGSAVLGVVQIGIVCAALAFGGHDGASASGATARAPVALVVLVAAWVMSGSFIGIVHRLLVPAGMMYQAAWWAMGYQSAIFAGLVAAAIARLDLVATSLLVATVQASVYFASAFYIRRRLPEFFPWWQRPDTRTAFSDLARSMTFVLGTALQQAATGGMVLLVGAVLGVAAVPVFTTMRTMANLWNTLTATLTSPLLPDLVRYHALGQPAKLVALVEAHAWLVGTLVDFGIVIGFPFMVALYAVWTRDALPLDRPLLAALLAAAALYNAGALMSVYLTGINDARAVLGLAFVRALLTLAAGAAALRFGVVGAGLGILLAEAACFALAARVLFPAALRRLDPATRRPRLGWAWTTAAASIAFLAVATFGAGPVPLLLALVAAAMLVSAWRGFRRLDVDVRRRLVELGGRWLPMRSGS
ncbi:hypothetical protein [Dokdonella sp.]|uniref:hypothetical protein n=1 Tax=Dokdonella sp. TaxID=2291710 RepID=UPI002F403986